MVAFHWGSMLKEVSRVENRLVPGGFIFKCVFLKTIRKAALMLATTNAYKS
tara:strand:+ start:212 stop:364 length:153 start_codon:yes stop_codon:yes gene_type:complete